MVEAFQIPKSLEWRCRNWPKSTISGYILENFEIFKGKGMPNHKYGKNYLLDILPP